MVEQYTVGNEVELTLWDRHKELALLGLEKVRGKITGISEKTSDGRAVYRIWINNDVYFLNDFREMVKVVQSAKADDLCLIISEES